jgi:site-specific DNA-cytosine methylase
VADHTPLIEQIDTWASELEKVQGAPRAVKRVIAEMRQTASDLRADNDADVKDGVCGNCGEEVNFDEHDRDCVRKGGALVSFTIKAADLFCGAGGASTGLIRAAQAFGCTVELLAVNHWPVAVETHTLNHPGVKHMCEAVERIDPRKAVPGGRLHLLLAGPECTHHSTARGGRPINDQSRATAWHILKWAQELYIDNILIENVPEFRQWGPLGANGRPLKSKKGQTYRAFLDALRSFGYRVEDRVVNAADYGDPTTRQRLFILAQRGQKRVAYPVATHSRTGGPTLFGKTRKWRAAREVIDWSVAGRSIFNRKKPLAPATMARILAGLEKFGGPELKPFLVVLRKSLDAPVLVDAAHGSTRRAASSRTRSLDEPLGTVTGRRFAVAAAVHRPNVARSALHDIDITATHGHDRALRRLRGRRAVHHEIQRHGEDGAVRRTRSTRSAPRDRFGLVQPVIDGYVLDIRFRMLQPHELAAATSFPKEYQFVGKKEDVVKQIGNAWPW